MTHKEAAKLVSRKNFGKFLDNNALYEGMKNLTKFTSKTETQSTSRTNTTYISHLKNTITSQREVNGKKKTETMYAGELTKEKLDRLEEFVQNDFELVKVVENKNSEKCKYFIAGAIVVLVAVGIGVLIYKRRQKKKKKKLTHQ